MIKIINNISCALRRVRIPGLKLFDTVIDIGSGGNPNPFADIICDYTEDLSDRYYKLKINRPFVFANVECLPFKDKAFDFSLLFHLLEHVEHPEKALDEIQRISHRGFIETPSAFTEYALPLDCHLSRCSVVDDTLYVKFKERPDASFPEKDSDVCREARKILRKYTKTDYKTFLTMYPWKDKINYKIIGNCNFYLKNQGDEEALSLLPKLGILRRISTKTIYLLIKIIKKLKRFNYLDTLACPLCKGNLDFHEDFCECAECKRKYSKQSGYFDFRV